MRPVGFRGRVAGNGDRSCLIINSCSKHSSLLQPEQVSWGSLDTESPLKVRVAMSRLGSREPILELLPALRRRARYAITRGNRRGTFRMLLRDGASHLHAVRGRAAPGLHALDITSVALPEEKEMERLGSGREDGGLRGEKGEALRLRLWVRLY